VKESDLYVFMAAHLERQGYRVQGEVRGCDLVALKGDDLIVMELKVSFNVKLLYQAVRRLAITPRVYAVVPFPARKQKGSFWQMLRSLARRLQIGLILIDDRQVKTLVEPAPFQSRTSTTKRDAVLKEFHGRKASTTIGGVTGQKLNTAYLESAVHIGVLLDALSRASPAELRELGTGEKTTRILYDNHYGWFQREGAGRYRLKTAQARRIREAHPEIWEYYAKEFQSQLTSRTQTRSSGKQRSVKKTTKKKTKKKAKQLAKKKARRKTGKATKRASKKAATKRAPSR
jgi:hypothetical protein